MKLMTQAEIDISNKQREEIEAKERRMYTL